MKASASTSGATAVGTSTSSSSSSSALKDLGSAGDHFSLLAASSVSAFVVDANEALEFNLVRKYKAAEEEKAKTNGNGESHKDENAEEDLGVEGAFAPEMCHQIYGDNENIFGYRGLGVKASMTAGTLKFKVSFNCDEKVSEKDGVAPDPVLEPLLKIFADGQVAKNDGEWKEEVEKDKKFRPLGNKLHEIQLEQQGESRQFEVYACDSTVSGFRDYHSRMQPWILFYIDAASFIDFDDANWRFFVMYERFKDEDDGSVRYAFAGYTTVYQYYAYPHMIRPRVSQMLVLPPFQRMGLGAHMLEEVQKFYWKNKEVRDITVEDPSDDFVRLRDFVDSRSCMSLDAFQPKNVMRGYSLEMVTMSNEEYKICRRQARRVYEILRLNATNKNNKAELEAFRSDVKARLSRPFLKEDKQLDKLKRSLTPEEYTAATMSLTNREQRDETIQTQYATLEDHYFKIVDRLSRLDAAAGGGAQKKNGASA